MGEFGVVAKDPVSSLKLIICPVCKKSPYIGTSDWKPVYTQRK